MSLASSGCCAVRATWSELGFFSLLSGERGACECRLLPGHPPIQRQPEQSLEFLRDLGPLTVRARGMVCKTSQLGVPSLSGERFLAFWSDFLGALDVSQL